MFACGGDQSSQLPANAVPGREPSSAYLALLTKFPEADQGLSREVNFPGLKEQPMTYALLLTAESLHYRSAPSDEGRRRVRNTTGWLISNSDLDSDGKPGWGLPDPWDAFGDGTTNPANQPYTITTGMVLLALMDSVSLPNFWNDSERDVIRTLMRQAALRQVQEVFTDTATGGYFWYSTNVNDAKFVTNVSAFMSGTLARLLREEPELFTISERLLIERRMMLQQEP